MIEYLTKEQVQETLHLSERQVKALFKLPGFPVVQIGQNVYVNADRLDAWMQQHEGTKLSFDYSRV